MTTLSRERRRYISAINRRNTRGELLHYYEYMLGLLGKSQDLYAKMFADNTDSEGTLMTISKFAKRCKIPVSTIRYYLRTQKLSPVSYTNSGYMLFSEKQVKDLLDIDL